MKELDFSQNIQGRQKCDKVYQEQIVFQGEKCLEMMSEPFFDVGLHVLFQPKIGGKDDFKEKLSSS